MLVVIPNFIEYPQRMLLRIRFVVWLELFDKLIGGSWQFLQSFVPTSREFLGIHADRKRNSGVQVRFLELPKLPKDIVHNAAEIVDTLGKQEIKRRRHLLTHLELDSRPGLFIGKVRVVFCYNFVGATIEEVTGNTVEISDILPCPSDTEAMFIGVISHENHLLAA